MVTALSSNRLIFNEFNKQYKLISKRLSPRREHARLKIARTDMTVSESETYCLAHRSQITSIVA
jgi:hypothetical protein